MKRQIVNLISFVRGAEPREPIDLVRPVREQLELLRRHAMPGTFLLQYDVLLEPTITDLLKNARDVEIEIGGWFELVQAQVEAAGLIWRGRPGYSWDWHAHVGQTAGYWPKERELLVDVFIQRFSQVFGRLPASIGGWTLDAHTLAYLSDRYGIVASCNCREQCGTDGLSLWGGYYGQGYYPCRNNMLSPAQTQERQIPVPVFRMLGSDPIYQYDLGLDLHTGETDHQQAATLEPVPTGGVGGGSVPTWVDWYLRENFSTNCLSFGYAQTGQENSFGWPRMCEGLTNQMNAVAALRDAGKLEVLTLEQTGRWYRAQYPVTPASIIAALTDWQHEGRGSVWYSSRYYRTNVFWQGDRFWLRDIHLFREDYNERYKNGVTERAFAEYDTLPLMDGNRWSRDDIRAGLYPVTVEHDETASTQALVFSSVQYAELNESTAAVTFFGTQCGRVAITLCETQLQIETGPTAVFALEARFGNSIYLPEVLLHTSDMLTLRYNGFSYSVQLTAGRLEPTEAGFLLYAENGFLALKLA